MRVGLVLSFLLGFLGPAHAQTQDFFFHYGASPLPIPGGTSNFFLDMTAPLDVPPLVDEHVLGQFQVQALPTFASAPFASARTLLPIASVRLNLSADKKMKHCARVTRSSSRSTAPVPLRRSAARPRSTPTSAKRRPAARSAPRPFE